MHSPTRDQACVRQVHELCIPLLRYYRTETRPQVSLPFLQRVRIARNADRCNSQGRSVCLSVCPSVSSRCFIQTNEDTIVRSSVSNRKIILVSGEVKFIRIFAGGHPQRGVKVKRLPPPVTTNRTRRRLTSLIEANANALTA